MDLNNIRVENKMIDENKIRKNDENE